MTIGETTHLRARAPRPKAPGEGRRRTDDDFHTEFQDERMRHHLEETLQEYKRRYDMGKQRLQREMQEGDELQKALKDLQEEYERLQEIAPEVAWHRRRVEKEAQLDKITGLDDKAAFAAMYEFALETLEDGEQVVLITFDLDKFKDINETIGHVNADHVLRRIGEAITSAIRSDDFATRIGGDEFTIILNRVKTGAEVLQLIQRIGQKISGVTWTTTSGEERAISFSAGYSTAAFGQHPFFEDVRKEADKLSGYSKRLKRNRLTVLDDGTKDRYISYELRLQADGSRKYVQAEQGSVAELETPTEGSCFSEVVSNGQRIAEEIERFFTRGTLKLFIQEKFPATQPIDLHDLNDRQKAKVLLHVRSTGKAIIQW